MFELIVGLLATFVGAALQASVGFGFAVISIPILALVDGRLVPVPQLLLSFPLAILMMLRERTHIDFGGVRWILVGRLVGGLATLPLLKVLTGDALDMTIGLLVLLIVATIAGGFTVPIRRDTQVAAGAVSGAVGLIASMGGPPLALLYLDQAAARLRSSLATVFLVGLSISLILRIGSDEIAAADFSIAALLLPSLIVGFVVGSRMAPNVDRRGVRTYVLIVSTLASVTLVARSLLT